MHLKDRLKRNLGNLMKKLGRFLIMVSIWMILRMKLRWKRIMKGKRIKKMVMRKLSLMKMMKNLLQNPRTT